MKNKYKFCPKCDSDEMCMSMDCIQTYYYRIEKDWIYKNLRCIVIVLTDRGYRCGYVGVDKNHKFYGKDYDNESLYNIDVHGGLTYSNSSEKSNYPVESDLWWFGFDCAHCNDAINLNEIIDLKTKEYYEKNNYMCNGEIKTLDFCIKECEKLADQLFIPRRGSYRPQFQEIDWSM